MYRVLRTSLIMGLLFGFHSGCSSQDQPPREDRQAAAAGRFYPGNQQELRSTLGNLFARAKPCTFFNIAAIVAPHAGYVYSGQVAASAYNQIDPEAEYDNIFILASSHQVSFMGASIYNKGDYITPLGAVTVNIPLADQLIRENPVFTFNPEADHTEHSLEVQIPFLQYHLKKKFRIVPIVLGTQSEETCKKIAKALKPWFNKRNLFIISSDFSHYPGYSDANKEDQLTCDAIVSNNPDSLLKTLQNLKKKMVPNLVTNLCGWTSVLTLLYMTANEPGMVIHPIQYMNSGDSKYGDQSQVVGYWSLAAVRSTAGETTAFSFTKEEQKQLLHIARTTIVDYVKDQRVHEFDPDSFSAPLTIKAGAFVTLKEKGALRGCIGRFTADIPLWQVVRDMAIASATEDNRFLPVTVAEIPDLTIEISVLSPMKKIYSPDNIVLGKHGIYIKKGHLSGTFLPQVATETGWSTEEFLGHCARDKAGLGWDGWKDAELFIYEAFIIEE